MSQSLARQVALITGARAPVALSLAKSFEAAGYDVQFADSVASLMTRWSSFGPDKLHRIRAPRQDFDGFVRDGAELVARLQPSLILPTCEEIFYLSRAAEIAGFSRLLFAPPLAVLRRLHSKAEFAELARDCGLHPPQTWRVTSTDELQVFSGDAGELVFKPEYSRFAAQTLIRPAASVLDKVRPSPTRPWVVQEFVSGEEVCVWSAARQGDLVAVAAYLPKWQFGGAGTYFLRDDDAGLTTMCRVLAEATSMTGQLSLDVVRTPEGLLRPIECNPRSVSGVHLFAGEPRLARALAGREAGLLTPSIQARYVGAAFWAAAVGAALRNGRIAEAVGDARRGQEVLSATGGGLATLGGAFDFAGFALRGLAAARSSVRESTADIEWNGEPL